MVFYFTFVGRPRASVYTSGTESIAVSVPLGICIVAIVANSGAGVEGRRGCCVPHICFMPQRILRSPHRR
jgi:hypothetical protein